MKKRTALIICILFLMQQLSACRAHFFNVNFDLPWWAVAVPVAVILLVAHIVVIRKTYICPKCGAHIKPRWYEISAWLHDGDTRVVKCRECGYKGFCRISDK